MANPRPCKRCGMRIDFLENKETGKMLPAQKIRVVYVLGDEKLEKLEVLEGDTYVSHFETCPEAGAFNKGRRR